ncbi:MAG: hypothetical protein IT315_06465 [Anaerolineales bacterium]|nr:hypothetical protein [Anaerolineales bacterium]
MRKIVPNRVFDKKRAMELSLRAGVTGPHHEYSSFSKQSCNEVIDMARPDFCNSVE